MPEHQRNCQCLECLQSRTLLNLEMLRKLHGSYDSDFDKLWHTIGEMDLMVEVDIHESLPDEDRDD